MLDLNIVEFNLVFKFVLGYIRLVMHSFAHSYQYSGSDKTMFKNNEAYVNPINKCI